MLSFAIASFFALAALTGISVIVMMFRGYSDRILDVLSEGLTGQKLTPVSSQRPYKTRATTPRVAMSQHRSMKPAPLTPAPMRAAA